MLVRPPNEGCQHDNADLANVLLEARPLLAVDSPARTGCRLDSRLLLNPQESTLSCRRVVWRGYEQPRGSLRAGRLNFISNIMWSCWQFRLRLCSFMAVRQDWPSVCILISLSTGTKAVPTVWPLWSSCWLEGQADYSLEQHWGSLRAGMLNLFQYFMILPTGREFCPIQPPSVLFAGWKTISLYSDLPFDWKQKLSQQFNNSGILADWKTR